MLTIFYLTIEIACYVAFCWGMSKLIVKSPKGYTSFIICCLLFLGLWIVGESFNQIHILLRSKGYSIELGHASIIDIAILFSFHLIGLFVCVYSFAKKKRLKDIDKGIG